MLEDISYLIPFHYSLFKDYQLTHDFYYQNLFIYLYFIKF